MTREQAAQIMKIQKPSRGTKEKIEAYEMAIKALSQEPCEDAISRQAVDDAIYEYSRACDVNYAQIMEYIDKLPSVKPQESKTGHWKYIGNGHNGLFECDNCGAHRTMFDELEKYCYACGEQKDIQRWG